MKTRDIISEMNCVCDESTIINEKVSTAPAAGPEHSIYVVHSAGKPVKQTRGRRVFFLLLPPPQLTLRVSFVNVAHLRRALLNENNF